MDHSPLESWGWSQETTVKANDVAKKKLVKGIQKIQKTDIKSSWNLKKSKSESVLGYYKWNPTFNEGREG